MRHASYLAAAVLAAALAGPLTAAEPEGGPAAPPASRPEAPAPAAPAAPAAAGDLPTVRLVPPDAVGFLHIPSLSALDADLVRFARETGWELGQGDHPATRAISLRTDITEGLDPAGPVTVAWLDPQALRNRYTIYILPVADWDRLLESTKAQTMGPGLYALTGTRGPRYVLRQGKLALVTSSIRTMEAVTHAPGSILDGLSAEAVEAARRPGVFLHLDVARLLAAYESEITAWFRAASGQLYFQGQAAAYADIYISYLLGIADLIDQMRTIEASLGFGEQGLSVDLGMAFAPDGSVGRFLSAQSPRPDAAPPIGSVPVSSAVTLQLDPAVRRETVLALVRFFVEKAPRPEPLPEPTKQAVYQALGEVLDALGPTIAMMSAPAEPGRGLVSEVSVYELTDPEAFRKSLMELIAAWERLASQLGLYLSVRISRDVSSFEGVPVTILAPSMRLGAMDRQAAFNERLRRVYGPEGLVYRLAIVGKWAVIGAGSDTRLLASVIRKLKSPDAEAVPPDAEALVAHLPATQNVSVMTSLPLYVRQALVGGGTSPARLGSVDPGQNLAGLNLRFEGSSVRMASWWPHEQIRLARELLARGAPALEQAPGSLFEPGEEGPPAPVEENAEGGMLGGENAE